MHTFHETLGDNDHAVFDAGLLVAARDTHMRLSQEAVRENDNTSTRVTALQKWKVPWWLESKIETPWKLSDYRKLIAERLHAVLKKNHASRVDVVSDDTRRYVQHWAHVLLSEAMPLHVKYEHADTKKPYDADDMLIRSRQRIRETLTQKAIVAENNEHPLWERGEVKKTHGGGYYRLAKPTQNQYKLVEYVIGPNVNIDQELASRSSDIVREAVPELLGLETRHLMEFSTALRAQFTSMIAGRETFTPALQRDLLNCVMETWLQINPNIERKIDALREDTKPDPLSGEASAVLEAYVAPFVTQKNVAALERMIPLLGYHTLSACAFMNEAIADRALDLWNETSKLATLPQRTTDLVLLAYKIAYPNADAKPSGLRRFV